MVNVFKETLKAVPTGMRIRKEFEKEEPATTGIISLVNYAGSAAVMSYSIRNIFGKNKSYPYVKVGTGLLIGVSLADDIADFEKKEDKIEFFDKIVDSYTEMANSDDPRKKTCFFLSNQLGEHFRRMNKKMGTRILEEMVKAELTQDLEVSFKEYEDSIIRNKTGKGIVLCNEVVSDNYLNDDEMDAIETVGMYLQFYDDLVDYKEDMEIDDINALQLLMRDEGISLEEARGIISEKMDRLRSEGVDKLGKNSIRPETRDFTLSMMEITESYLGNLENIRKIQKLF